MTKTNISTTGGIVVSTDLTAGGVYDSNHAEGIVVSTNLTAGGGGNACPIWQCGFNHAEGIVVSTNLTAGDCPYPYSGCSGGNHSEGIVVSTGLAAGMGQPVKDWIDAS